MRTILAAYLTVLLIVFSGSVHAAKAPDFTVFDQSGNSISLIDYRGKGVVLHFWGTWCPFCRDLQPGLDRLYRKYKGSGLEVLGISIREETGVNPEIVLKELGVSFKTAVNGDNIARMYDVPGTPATFFIDRRGELIWKTHSSNADSPEFEANIRLILYLDQ